MEAKQSTVVTIRALAHGGEGVGEPIEGGGPTWFVPGALPHEEVEAEVEHQGKRFVRGKLLAVIRRAPERVEPGCPWTQACGGCDWQHVRSADQGAFKVGIVADQLRHVMDPKRVSLTYEGEGTGYRRRVRMHYARSGDRFELGFLGSGSHELVDVPHCAVLDAPLNAALARLRERNEGLPDRGQVFAVSDGRHVVLGLPGVRPDTARPYAESLVGGEVAGVELRGGRSHAVLGQATLGLDSFDRLPALRTGPFDFAQAQSAGNQELVRTVARAARAKGLRVLELFAGNGNFTRALAAVASEVHASDSDRDAVEALRRLAKANELPVVVRRQQAATGLKKLAEAETRYDIAVVDPPRSGLGEAETALLARIVRSRIVYVSCDPATLARDIRVAVQHGFEVVRAEVLDLMPMTSSVEVVCTLARRPR